MSTSDEIAVRRSAVSAVIGGHNAFAGAFNQGAQALTPFASEFQDLIIALNEAAVLHNESVPLILADKSKWDNEVPVSPPPSATESPDGARGATVTDAAGIVWSFGVARAGGSTTLRDGQPWPVAGPGGAVEYGYKNHTVYVRNSSSAWFSATTTWAQAVDPFTAPYVPPQPSPDVPNLPWRIGKPVFVPFAVPGTSRASIQWEGRLAYSGAAPDYIGNRCGFVLLAPGGHAIDNGDQVAGIDYMQPQPIWTEYLADTGTAGDVPYQADGHPSGMHTYGYTWVIRRHNIAVRLVAYYGYPSAGIWNNTDIFDLTTKQWRPNDPAKNKPVYTGYRLFVPACGQDPVTEDIYFHDQTESWVFRADTLTWEPWPWEPWQNARSWGYGGMLVDKSRNVKAMLDPGTFKIETGDLTTRAYVPRQGTMPADFPVGNAEYNAFTHDTDNDFYWYAQRLPGRTDIIRSWAINATSLQTVLTVDLPYSDAGPCNRFHFFPAMHAIMYVPKNVETICIPTK